MTSKAVGAVRSSRKSPVCGSSCGMAIWPLHLIAEQVRLSARQPTGNADVDLWQPVRPVDSYRRTTGCPPRLQLEQAPDLSRHAWHDDGMNRIRLSTTVDASLLEHARSVRSGTTDAALIDEALAALLARYRSAEVDASYAAYDEHPLEEPDEWGDLASFRRAVASS